MPIQDETIQKFQDLFACTKGFQAVPLTNTPDENGKIRYKYTAFQGPIKTQHYRNHFNTAIGLTPSPIVDNEWCKWGAIDIDKYDLNVQSKVKLITKSKQKDNKKIK